MYHNTAGYFHWVYILSHTHTSHRNTTELVVFVGYIFYHIHVLLLHIPYSRLFSLGKYVCHYVSDENKYDKRFALGHAETAPHLITSYLRTSVGAST